MAGLLVISLLVARRARLGLVVIFEEISSPLDGGLHVTGGGECERHTLRLPPIFAARPSLAPSGRPKDSASCVTLDTKHFNNFHRRKHLSLGEMTKKKEFHPERRQYIEVRSTWVDDWRSAVGNLQREACYDRNWKSAPDVFVSGRVSPFLICTCAVHAWHSASQISHSE